MISLQLFSDELQKLAARGVPILRKIKRLRPPRVGGAREAVMGPEKLRLRKLLRERLPEGVAGRLRAKLRAA